MESRQIATYLARARVGVGLALLVTPRLTLRVAIGPLADAPVTAPLGRLAGVRDAVLGAGGSIALGEGTGGANWLSMAALVDGVDALVVLATPGLARRARLIGVAAAGTAVYQLVLAREIAASERVDR